MGELRASRKGGLLVRPDRMPAGEAEVENLAKQLLQILWALNQATKTDTPSVDEPFASATQIQLIQPLTIPGPISLTVSATGAAFPPNGDAAVLSLRPAGKT